MTHQENNPQRQIPNQRLSGVQITLAMVIAFGLILAINFSGRIAAGQPLIDMYENVKSEVEQLEEEQATLIAIRDYSESDTYVEQWARSEGKLVRDGEILVVPVPASGQRVIEATPVPIPTVPVQTTLPQPENWMLWWSLFFDSQPPTRSTLR